MLRLGPDLVSEVPEGPTEDVVRVVAEEVECEEEVVGLVE